jgi:hypothetical protein
MLLTEPNTAYWITETLDAYGTVTSEDETRFSCLIEKETQFAFGGGNVLEVGKGVIFTTVTSLAFDTGQKVRIGNDYFVFKKVYEAEGMDGEFSHWEITYG